MLKEIRYFKRVSAGDDRGVCGDDFKNSVRSEWVNIRQVSSLSGSMVFELPFSGKIAGEYHMLTMANGDIFYLKPGDYMDVLYHSDNVMD